ncbi:MAG: alpha/beta hydrolase fold domain-containing protein [Devosia sp.]|nr:alpha/beta hydrolase fold domain-containing protein [Devosia sp.]
MPSWQFWTVKPWISSFRVALGQLATLAAPTSSSETRATGLRVMRQGAERVATMALRLLPAQPEIEHHTQELSFDDTSFGGRRTIQLERTTWRERRSPSAADAGAKRTAVLLCHGGAFVVGSSRLYRLLTRALVSRDVDVVCFDYRLAPEAPFPCALHDALDVYRHLLQQQQQQHTDDDVAPRRLVLMGDSAGGGLALSLLLACKRHALPMPDAMVGLSPWLDLTFSGASVVANRELELLLPTDGLVAVSRLYAPEPLALDEPLVSPVFASREQLAGLPPMLLHVGREEILLDDTRRLAARARDAGVSVSTAEFAGMPHVFHILWPWVPEAREAMADVNRFIRRHCGLAEPESSS